MNENNDIKKYESLFDIFEQEEASFVKNYDDSNEPKIKKIGNYYFKMIEKDKSSIAKSGIVFLEPLVMEYCRNKGLSAPKVVGIEEKEDKALFVTESVDGENAYEYIKNNPEIKDKIEAMCEQLKNMYNASGIERQMDLKDMILIMEDNEIKKIVPLDFERVNYNENLDFNLLKQVAEKMKIDISKFIDNKNNEKATKDDDRDEL